MGETVPHAVVSTASSSPAWCSCSCICSGGSTSGSHSPGCSPVLFMGTASEVLLWPFEVCLSPPRWPPGSGRSLALERGEERGDAIACGLLPVSLAFSELGVSFALGAALAHGHRPPFLVAARATWSSFRSCSMPLWYAGWGHVAESHLSPCGTSSTARSTSSKALAASASAAGRCSQFVFELRSPRGACRWSRSSWQR